MNSIKNGYSFIYSLKITFNNVTKLLVFIIWVLDSKINQNIKIEEYLDPSH